MNNQFKNLRQKTQCVSIRSKHIRIGLN